MLRRDTPQRDTSELSETLRRLASVSGGGITVMLDGRPIARAGAQPGPGQAHAGRPAAGDDPADARADPADADQADAD